MSAPSPCTRAILAHLAAHPEGVTREELMLIGARAVDPNVAWRKNEEYRLHQHPGQERRRPHPGGISGQVRSGARAIATLRIQHLKVNGRIEVRDGRYYLLAQSKRVPFTCPRCGHHSLLTAQTIKRKASGKQLGCIKCCNRKGANDGASAVARAAS